MQQFDTSQIIKFINHVTSKHGATFKLKEGMYNGEKYNYYGR